MNLSTMTRILLITLMVVFVACKQKDNSKTNVHVARVYDKYLNSAQIMNIVPKGLSKTDSANIVKDHIDKWVREQLLMHQAQQYLSQDDKNVEQQIEDYRSSLLIFKYEQNFIKQKLDTSISDKQIEEYYSTHSSNFILNSPLIKGLYIQVAKNAQDIAKVKKIYRSDNTEDIRELESYCYHYASKYDYFDENWIYFDKIYNKIPETYIRPENILQSRKYYEAQDSAYFYLVKISDYKLAGEVAPMEFIKEDIKSILLNKKKIELINELESDIYNDALNHENFTVY
jgi:hypothetical protein